MTIIERINIINDYVTCNKRDTCLKCACDGILCDINNLANEKRDFFLDTIKTFKKCMMKVICISDRMPITNIIEKGEIYEIDRYSIWVDSDGDAYGSIYKNGKQICQSKIAHFQSI